MARVAVSLVVGGLVLACTEPAPESLDAGPCRAVVRDVAPGESPHVPDGTEIAWSANPPVGGPHFPSWGRWGESHVALERGYWVHNLEHGGVVLLHNCPSGCADDVARLEALLAAFPVDASCTAPVRARLLIAADPLLPAGVPIAAAAWGRNYTAACVDEQTLGAFVRATYASAPEDTCAQGREPSVPAADAGPSSDAGAASTDAAGE